MYICLNISNGHICIKYLLLLILRKIHQKNTLQKSFLSKKGWIIEQFCEWPNGPLHVAASYAAPQVVWKGITKGRPPMIWKWKLAKKILPHQVHDKTLITIIYNIYTPQVEQMESENDAFQKKLVYFQGAIFRWTILNSGRLFTNKNRSQSHQDTWHLEHTATQDLLEGQKKPRIEKNDPRSTKNGQMLWCRGGMGRSDAYPPGNDHISLLGKGTCLSMGIFSVPRRVTTQLPPFPPPQWPKSKPTSSNTVCISINWTLLDH